MHLYTERVALESTLLAAATYDPDRSQLQLDFHDGARYIYSPVSPVIFAELIQAPSKGRFFNRYIRGNFSYVKANVEY